MNTIDYLFGPQAHLFWPGVVTALLVGVLGAVLSPIVVLKRMAFIGQGVSHAAFGGVGLGLALGLGGASLVGQAGLAAVVLAFSIAAALGIAWLSDKPQTKPDTAIGIVLAASMAVGFVLYRLAGDRFAAGTIEARPPDLHAVLFGDVLAATWGSAGVAGAVLLLVLLVLWLTRRSVLFWGFDESVSRAFGVDAGRTRSVLLVLLAVSVVVAVNLAGIVLATALFVLPGAIALSRTDRLARVWAWSVLGAVLATGVGLVLSFEADLVAGPSVVIVMAGAFVAARALPGA